MNPTSKKLISLFLLFSLVTINCASLRTTGGKREKHGATLLIKKNDGQQIRGELITVKPNSLLLLNTDGKDVSVKIEEIKTIIVVKKSKAGTGVLIGLLIGGGGGALYWFKAARGAGLGDDAASAALLFGSVTAVVGGIIGGLFGAAAGDDETIQIEGMTDLEIREALDKLRKKARIRDYK